MAISLYRHNQDAYEAAVLMLSTAGKAAVIHPTGTGKSFIGFKLCEDHPDKSVLWLSPSRYIFETQLENLADAANGWQPENVTFLTYAALLHLTEEEIQSLQPDYIILDEFHRCGAQQWGKGVRRLLEAYGIGKSEANTNTNTNTNTDANANTNVPALLGLSATAIRYLDNQRDMSDELFEGHVASVMTLGECIARGILNPPVYVRSVYSWKSEEGIARYTSRIRNLQNPTRRAEAEQILEKLRREISRAEGLDRIFDRRMTDRTGKYIIFCATNEAMQEAKRHIGEWFARVDRHPRVYTVYTEDPGAGKSFREFRVDQENDHLRLLLCIDALNEGVHVEDVSGVILLRPTVSPIIYKQQIGRALSASRRKNPVIFDIVNNIESLYSIDAIRDEMREALSSMKTEPGEADSFTEIFEVIDEVRSCLELFEALEDVLTPSWDVMYREARAYYEANKDLMVPVTYFTEKGYSLGRWIRTQRVNYRRGEPALTDERIAALDQIGMDWGSVLKARWLRMYRLAKRYYNENGNLTVPYEYEAEGQKLGLWISTQRDSYKHGRLKEEQIRLLEAIDMSWDRFESKWDRAYSFCRRYVLEVGNINEVPKDFAYDEFRPLSWIQVQRNRKKSGKLTQERIRRLEEIGIVWDVYESLWENGYAHACDYRKAHGNMKVPTGYICEDGFKLKYWLNNQITRRRTGRLTPVQLERLEAIGC